MEKLLPPYLDKLDLPPHWKGSGEKLRFWQDSEIEVMGVKFVFPVLDGSVRPLVITPNVPEMTIPIDRELLRLHILGQVTMPGGYPIEGDAGETVATYTLHYASGKVREIPLRQGLEVARANVVFGATRFDPVATAAQRALLFVKNIANAQYQALLYSLTLEGGKVSSISCRLNRQQQPLLVFAVTSERQ